MSIVRLFEPPRIDAVLKGDLDGWVFYIAYVVGAGECSHKHRLEQQADRCGRRMRHWLDYEQARNTSVRVRGDDGKEYLAVYRHGPGPRPSRKPW